MTPYAWSLVVGTVAGLADVLGALILTGRRRWDRAALNYFLAVGAGFMLAAAFVRMLPESVEKLPHAFFFLRGAAPTPFGRGYPPFRFLPPAITLAKPALERLRISADGRSAGM